MPESKLEEAQWIVQALNLVEMFDGHFPEQHLEDYLSYYRMDHEEFDSVLDRYTNRDLFEKANGRWSPKYVVGEDFYMKIAIVDYGMGNLHSVRSALNYIGVEKVIVSADESRAAERISLFFLALVRSGLPWSLLNSMRLDHILKELVVGKQKPVLGICLGMQLLGLSSNEGGYTEGLSLIDGKVDAFDEAKVVVPHVGYNQVQVQEPRRLYYKMKNSLDFYFVHSFKMLSSGDIGESMCKYGQDFVAGFERDNMAGTQYHPELSQTNGLELFEKLR